MTLETLLAVAGTLGFLLYFVMGLKASSLQLAAENTKGIDRLLYSAMSWSLDPKSLKPEGRRMCHLGNFVMVGYSVIWVAWAFVKYA
jgi:hypothetical protein